MEILKGVGVANGIAIGKALLLLDEETVVIQEEVPENRIDAELDRFNAAIQTAKEQIWNIKQSVEKKIGEEHAFIFDTHVMFLDDRSLVQETIKFIKEKQVSAQWAFSQVLMRILKEFAALDDNYFMERAKDLEDVGKRLLRILCGEVKEAKERGFKNLKGNVIIVGCEFGPSNITSFDNPNIIGFATDQGGQTTHTAIIAKALGIPAVLGLHNITAKVQSGDTVVLDSLTGDVVVNPNEKTLKKYEEMRRIYKQEEESYVQEVSEPAITKDGHSIDLHANIELPSEVATAVKYGTLGVGLYRTEFLYLQFSPELPSEETHFRTYCDIAEMLGGRPMTIRTLDLGGEKFFHRTFVREKEINPVMGLRGVRLCLVHKEIFRSQIRALLRAAHIYKNIEIMFPLITGLGELHSVKAFLEEIKAELKSEGMAYEENPRLGVMIEVPSAAMIADHLAQEVDFFSIGTNDLIQYFLAIDRANDDVSYLYDPFHPGFVRVLSNVIQAANSAGIDVSCCGEMASSPLNATLLMALGLRKLSMNPSSLPNIHHLICALDLRRFQEISLDSSTPHLGRDTRDAFLKGLKEQLSAKDYAHLIGDAS